MNKWLEESKYKGAWTFCNELLKKLVAPEQRQLQAQIDRLVMSNIEHTSGAVLAFIQEGVVYSHSRNHIQHRGATPSLAFALTDEFNVYRKAQNNLSHEIAVMRQTLWMLYSETFTLQELRDSTPECLVHFVDEFQGVGRNFDELFLVRSNTRLVRQYTKTLELIKIHAASHLLY